MNEVADILMSKRDELRHQIYLLIEKFEKDTGLVVNSIEVERSTMNGNHFNVIADIRL